MYSHVKAVGPVHQDLQVLRRNTKKGMLCQLQMESEKSSTVSSGEDCVLKRVVQKNLKDVDIVHAICQ